MPRTHHYQALNQQGFDITLVGLLLIILIGIGGAWYVIQAHNSSDKSDRVSTTAGTNTTAPSISSKAASGSQEAATSDRNSLSPTTLASTTPSLSTTTSPVEMSSLPN